jgi:hypothetical protein
MMQPEIATLSQTHKESRTALVCPTATVQSGGAVECGRGSGNRELGGLGCVRDRGKSCSFDLEPSPTLVADGFALVTYVFERFVRDVADRGVRRRSRARPGVQEPSPSLSARMQGASSTWLFRPRRQPAWATRSAAH